MLLVGSNMLARHRITNWNYYVRNKHQIFIASSKANGTLYWFVNCKDLCWVKPQAESLLFWIGGSFIKTNEKACTVLTWHNSLSARIDFAIFFMY